MTSPAGDGQSAVTEETGQGAGSTTEVTTTGTTGTGAQSGAEGTGEAGAATTEETVPKASHDQLRAQLAAADRKRQEAETALQAVKDKDLPEMDRMKRDLASVTARAEKAEAALTSERIANAFYRDNTYAWHDPAAAMKMADLTDVSIAEDGTVTGMKEALKKLATANAWMINKGGSAEDVTPPAGGAPAMNNGGGTNRPAGAAALTGRLSAMRTRQRPKTS